MDSLETQDKIIGAVRASFPGLQCLNSDFDGEWLSLSFNTIPPGMMGVIEKIIPKKNIMQYNKTIHIQV